MLVSGYVTVTSSYARWYFVSFYCVGVLTMLNICVAFILSTYSSIRTAVRDEAEASRAGAAGAAGAAGGPAADGADASRDVITFDAERVVGPQQGVSGLFDVALADVPLPPSDPRYLQLRGLFLAGAEGAPRGWPLGIAE